MSKRDQFARQPLRSGAGLHANEHWVGGFKEPEQRLSRKLRALYWLSGSIHCDNVKDLLTDVDAVGRRFKAWFYTHP